MPRLPPDFWTKADAFSMVGLIAGLAIGFAVSWRLPGDGGYLSWQSFLGRIIIGGIGLVGMFAGELVRLWWLGYL